LIESGNSYENDRELSRKDAKDRKEAKQDSFAFLCAFARNGDL
jgi:hypothetical protein